MSVEYPETGETTLDELLQDHTVTGSFAEFLKWALGDRFALADHFEAITTADLLIPYTETAAGGGTAAVYLDNEPSAVELNSNGVNLDGYTLESDRTFSLQALGGTTLIFECRARINSEADILFQLGMLNSTTNNDGLVARYDTGGGVPSDDGCLSVYRDGAVSDTAATLASTLDLTVYHTYRLEMEPGAEARLYVDDALEATDAVAGNIPIDQTFVAYLILTQRAVGAAKMLYVDYYKVWSE